MKNIEEQTSVDFPSDIISQVQTPCYLISEDAVERNCITLDKVQKQTGVKILLALKAFALPALFPLIGRYLKGVCASGPVEARLGREFFGAEVHTYSPAYTQRHFDQVLAYSDFVLFNSLRQWRTYGDRLKTCDSRIKAGLRVNPGHAEVETDLYNPCLPGSRFGISARELEGQDLNGLTGLHFHALCEQNADVLARVLSSFEKLFGQYLGTMEWVNFGGGHHITRSDYDLDLLFDIITDFRKKYGQIDIYLEPGEAVVLNAGIFVTSVIDVVHNDMETAILDASAETHMPDVLGMPYRPHVINSGKPDEREFTYRLGGISCLAGDVIGDYSFHTPLCLGDRLVLTDMALYSFVKNNTFNGVELPSIYTYSAQKQDLKLIRQFDFNDYLSRIS